MNETGEQSARTGFGPAVSTLLWRVLAIVNIVLAVLGMLLPVMPTVPFLIVAAWAGGRGWPRLESWLLEHPRYGHQIRRWREQGAVPRRAKWGASAMMLVSIAVLAFAPVAPWVKFAVPAMMAIVAVWLWTRPDG